jgi:hypothetical protein
LCSVVSNTNSWVAFSMDRIHALVCF